MVERKSISPAQKKQEAAQIWLSYYNRVLYEKGIISEQERSRMMLPSAISSFFLHSSLSYIYPQK